MDKIPPYVIPPLVALTDRLIPRYNISDTDQKDEVKFVSYLGTPVYSPLEFLNTPGLNASSVNSKKSDTLLRIDTVLINVDQGKRIVMTEIQGRDTSIKEYIGLSDFMVAIEGEIVSPYPDFFPQDDVELLLKLCRYPGQLEVACDFLLLFGIKFLVIKDFSVSQKLGSRNSVPFRLLCHSDEDENIDIFE